MGLSQDLTSFLLISNGTPLQYSCLENPMDGGAWWAAVNGVAWSRTWLSDFTFPFHFHALEKEMATHSSVLAWRIPGMAEPGGVSQSRTQLKRLSSSSSYLYPIQCSFLPHWSHRLTWSCCLFLSYFTSKDLALKCYFPCRCSSV